MPQLRIPSHMSGEQYITKAALIADPSMRVTVFPGTKLVLRDYKDEALRKGLTLLDLFHIRHGHALATEQDVYDRIHEAQCVRLKAMAAFLRLGVRQGPGKVRVEESADVDLQPLTSGSTAAVADFYRQPADRHPQDQIVDALFGSPDASWHETKLAIEKYYEDTLERGRKYAFFWGRKSGEIAGQGPWLDTNENMLAQMMISIRRRDPGRRLVIIGDPVRLPSTIDGHVVPAFDVSLVQYWDHGFPGGRDPTAQLYFLRLLIVFNRDAVSIGTNSGILELPHLMGMKTVYLENDHLHKRKGLRWQMLAANYAPAENPATLGTLQARLAAMDPLLPKNARSIENYQRRIEAIQTRKVDILGAIRPNLQRFSTSTATELWSSRKALFDQVRAWLTKPMSTQAPVHRRAHNDFLVKVVAAATTSADEPAQGNEAAPAWSAFHEAKNAWALVRGADFCGDFRLQADTLRAMRLCMESQHSLRSHEIDRFWEVFNSTYLGQPGGPSAPSWKAAYRGWLKDSEDIWNYVLSRRFDAG